MKQDVRTATEVDAFVGSQLKQLRKAAGFSQTELANKVGVTFQQIQKYERGVNRIGSSRLYELGQILDVPVSFFFDDMVGSRLPGAAQSALPGLAESSGGFDHGDEGTLLLERRETLELIRAYYRITDSQVRKRLFELAKALGNPEAMLEVSND